MSRFIAKRITLFTAGMILLNMILIPLTVSASTAAQVCSGATASTSGTCPAPSGPTIQQIMAAALNIFSIVIGFISVVMVMVGGLKYITSQGDPGSINSAKNTILYALVGIVVAVMAQALVRFVLSRVS